MASIETAHCMDLDTKGFFMTLWTGGRHMGAEIAFIVFRAEGA